MGISAATDGNEDENGNNDRDGNDILHVCNKSTIRIHTECDTDVFLYSNIDEQRTLFTDKLTDY